jgi:4-carboxymuconolactone decarboxylase
MPPSTSQPRIRPLEPPYPPGVEAALRAMMPRNAPVEPLRLFRTFVHAPVMADAMTALGRFVLGRELALDLHDRGLVVHRVCARCRCEYEWGVHAASFAPRAGLSAEQLDATVTAGAGAPAWNARDALLVRLVDELHDTATVADALWQELEATWSTEQLLELLLLAGWYHAISYLANGARVELEPWAARFPDAAST